MSERRVLIVDDEQVVLNGIERRLGERFAITTCNSPREALEILKQTKEFAVVISDMRMPEMDGIRFIEKAKAIAPGCVYMMLTGNQDLQTLMQAVNGNRIFRYMTKPCSSDELAGAIDAALAKFSESDLEDQLLRATFSGAVDVMHDLLATSHPMLGAVCERVKYLLALASENLGWPKDWELEITSRLCLAGFSMVPENKVLELLDTSAPFDASAQATLQQGLKNSRKMLSRIPRLEGICNIINQMCGDDSALPNEAFRRGELLGLLFVQALAVRKPHYSDAMLKSAYPNANDEMIAAVVKADQKFMAGKDGAESISLKQLLAGMIVADDVIVEEKAVLRCGDVVTSRVREHLFKYKTLPDAVSAFVFG